MDHVRLYTNQNPISIDYENPIGNSILWEHAHPAYQSGDQRLYKEGAKEILATMRRWRDRYRERGAAVHVGLSTDGTREWKIWDVKELAKMCVGEGFSIELMMASREASRWNGTDRRIAEDFAKGAGLI
jgi:hypothetical protein